MERPDRSSGMDLSAHSSPARIGIWTVPHSFSGAAFVTALAPEGYDLIVTIDAGSGPRATARHWRARLKSEGLSLVPRALLWPARWLHRRRRQATPVADVARRFGVPVTIVSDLNSPEAAVVLEAQKLDHVLVAGTRILSAETLRLVSGTILNYHTGILPHYRGTETIFWALVTGGPVGFTFHEISPELDRGPIHHEQIIHQGGYRDPEDCYDDCLRRAVERLPSLVRSIVDRTASPQATRPGGKVYRAPAPGYRARCLRDLRRGILVPEPPDHR